MTSTSQKQHQQRRNGKQSPGRKTTRAKICLQEKPKKAQKIETTKPDPPIVHVPPVPPPIFRVSGLFTHQRSLPYSYRPPHEAIPIAYQTRLMAGPSSCVHGQHHIFRRSQDSARQSRFCSSNPGNCHLHPSTLRQPYRRLQAMAQARTTPILSSLSFPMPRNTSVVLRNHRRSPSMPLADANALTVGEDSVDMNTSINAKPYLVEAPLKQHGRRIPSAESPPPFVREDDGKKLILTVSASPTDNMAEDRIQNAASKKPKSGGQCIQKLSTPSPLDSRAAPSLSRIDRSYTESKMDEELPLDDTCFGRHARDDSFSLLPDLENDSGNIRTSPPMMPYLSYEQKPSWEDAEDTEMNGSESSPDEPPSFTSQFEAKMVNETLSRNTLPLFFVPKTSSSIEIGMKVETRNEEVGDSARCTPSSQFGTEGEGWSTGLSFDFNPSCSSQGRDEKTMEVSPGRIFATEITRDDSFSSGSYIDETREGPPRGTVLQPASSSSSISSPCFHLSPIPPDMPSRPSNFAFSSSTIASYKRPQVPSRPQEMSSPSTSTQNYSRPKWHPGESKHRCFPLREPAPSKFQGDCDKWKNTKIPEFSALVNYPGSATVRQNRILPSGIRFCVMCGQIRASSSRMKQKKEQNGEEDTSHLLNQSEAPCAGMIDDSIVIPVQNKGLCTLCDVQVWVIRENRTQIKWCKGCKNFRSWAAFGEKGQATKCMRCRDRQRVKYALVKDSKQRNRGAHPAKRSESKNTE